MFFWGLLLGMLIGGTLGVLIMGLMCANSKAD